MNNHQKIAALLKLTSQNLDELIRPSLTGERRFSAAMIARALTVAANRLDRDQLMERRQVTDLLDILQWVDTNDLAQLQTILIKRMREGRFDGDAGKELRARMRGWIRARLDVSDPNYLASLTAAEARKS